MQLDLIQHQQEQLLKKDRQLQGLKQDRAALCLRLEKQEKRNAFFINKLLEMNKNVTNCSSENGTVNNKLENADRVSEDQTEDSHSTNKINSRTLIKSCNNSIKYLNLNHSNKSSIDNVDNQSLIIKNDLLNSVETNQTQSAEPEQQINNKVAPVKDKNQLRKRNRPFKQCDSDCGASEKYLSESPSKSGKEESSNEALSKSQPNKKKKTGSKGVNKKCDQNSIDIVNTSKVLSTNIPILETDEPYYLYNCREEAPHSLSVETKVSSNLSPFKYKSIETPSWRLNPVSSCYSLEGTEVVFLNCLLF
jgi:hypothetical protein